MPESNSQNETPLIEAVRHGDVGAFETLFRRYHATLFRHVWYRCRDADVAADIAQETFVRIWQTRRRLISRRPLLPLLVSIAGNLLRDLHKHALIEQRHRDDVIASGVQSDENPDSAAETSLLQDRIAAIAERHMTGTCRLVFILSRVDGRDNGEIAGMLKISRKAVENHLFRALKTLRKCLPPRE